MNPSITFALDPKTAPIVPMPADLCPGGEPWPTPRPLAGPTPPSLDLKKAIPPGLAPFQEFCEAVAEALQVPQDAVPPLALALTSIGTSRALELKLAPDWRETAPLWFAVLAESGERKSALLGLLAAPVYDWQAGETARLRDPLASYAEQREALASPRGPAERLLERIERARDGDAIARSLRAREMDPSQRQLHLRIGRRA